MSIINKKSGSTWIDAEDTLIVDTLSVTPILSALQEVLPYRTVRALKGRCNRLGYGSKTLSETGEVRFTAKTSHSHSSVEEQEIAQLYPVLLHKLDLYQVVSLSNDSTLKAMEELFNMTLQMAQEKLQVENNNTTASVVMMQLQVQLQPLMHFIQQNLDDSLYVLFNTYIGKFITDVNEELKGCQND